eukprot:TRINITY_DN37889_c0_g1_i1.p1 TRINITY_DN37889_c0_g1~~TRINITY_DN37889_c0_g1_i1.p1  ORF type:complete len:341 (+),score=67.70 TRINITY_DN37889_c0_g1_i1:164-1186(+)
MSELPPIEIGLREAHCSGGGGRESSVLETPRLENTPRANFVTQKVPKPPVQKNTELVRTLLSENKEDLRRIYRKHDVQRQGWLTVDMVIRGVMNELTLNPQRDALSVQSICQQAATDGKVTLDALFASVERQHPKLDQTRYKAAGIMDPTIQKATTGSVVTPLGYSYEGPPFAVTSDADHMTAIIQDFHSQRKAQLEEKLKKFSKDGMWLTHKEFLSAVPYMDKYQVPEYEVLALIQALDPGRKKGRINIKQFLLQFGPEYLKNKSSRATIGGNIDGNTNTLQWPASLDDSYDRKRVMQELRTKRAPKLRAGNKPKRINHSMQPTAPPSRRVAPRPAVVV